MAEAIIKKNFSNYSAWHYRGKLMPRLYERAETRYVLPLERIQEDLEMLKHAFFTEPKDQSAWNYHEWLISLVTPIQIAALAWHKDTATLEIGLSALVKNFTNLKITVSTEDQAFVDYSISPKKDRDYSYIWLLKLPQDCQSFTLSIT